MENTFQFRSHPALSDELREQASMYALGLLEVPETGQWEDHLEHCSLCADEVRASREILGTVAAAERAMAQPAARVKETLMRRIAAEAQPATALNNLRATILRATEGTWLKTLPGIEVKRLFIDPVTRSVTSLVRVAAGAIYPAHIHRGLEHLYVLNGDIVFDDHTLSTGDYEFRSPDTRHSSATTAPGEGCLLLVINSGRDEFLP
jgi:anti-sigma factor ChrR (cupin superfamily)